LKLGIKGPGIPSQNLSHGFFALLFVFARIEALQAAAGGAAVQFDTKALTVEFETASLFASAAHNLHFVAVRGFNLCGRCGAQTVDSVLNKGSTVQRGHLGLAAVYLVDARWRLLLLVLLLLVLLLLLLQAGIVAIVLVNGRLAHFVVLGRGGGARG
jgi:hypothetical protein